MGRFCNALVALALAGCAPGVVPHYPRNAEDAANSTFMVELSIDGEEVGTGTAWIYKNDDDGTYLLTAGHVCPTGEGTNSYNLVGWGGESYRAYEIMRSDDPDLCVLRSPAHLGSPLALADEMPPYNADLYVVGAPHSHYGDGMAPIYHGNYIGGDRAVGGAIPGLSGSAVISERGVVGVLVEGYFRDNIYHMMSITQIRDFLDVK